MAALMLAFEVEQSTHSPLTWLSRLTSPNLLVRHLPTLIDATVEDLADGLGRGCFTSVDLVKVWRTSPPFHVPNDILVNHSYKHHETNNG